MDRNTIIGLVLIAGIVLTWTLFFTGGDDKKPQQPASKPNVEKPMVSETDTAQAPTATLTLPTGVDSATFATMSDSAKAAVIADGEARRASGIFAPLYKGTDRVIEVETDRYKVAIHTKGARMGSLELKDFLTADSAILPIQTDKEVNGMSVNFIQTGDVTNPEVASRDLYFEPGPSSKVTVTGESQESVSFKAKLDDAHYLEYIYTFKGNTYDYSLEIKQVGMKDLAQNQYMFMDWQAEIPRTERAMALMREKTTLQYNESGSVDALGPTWAEAAPDTLKGNLDWLAFKSQFFTHTLLFDNSAKSEKISMAKVWQANAVVDPNDPEVGEVVKAMHAQFDLPIAMSPTGSIKFDFYAGPLDYDILGQYDRQMIKQINLGWGPLQYVNRWLTIPIFNFLEGFIGNYGMIILILGLVIKTLIYPLTYRTYISTAKMRVVNNLPEVKELEAKMKDDPTKLQQAKMAFYKKYGVSMFGGCWPMLVQYPFLIALFFFFPNAIELRQQSFLWAPDLSTYDSVLDLGFNIPMYGDHVSLFTLLMTASIFGYTIINQKMQPQATTNPVMKWFPYIMPIFLLAFLNRYSAGLSWYYFLSNLISIAQTIITKRFVDDDKIMEKLRVNAAARDANPDKKQGTLEKWASRQQERQREIANTRAEARGEGKSQGPKTTAPKKRR